MRTCKTIVGDIDDNGRFPARIKFASAGGNPNTSDSPGIEKSAISLFNKTPVEGERILDPNPVLMVDVIETAFLSPSTIEKCVVPPSLSSANFAL